MSFAKFMQSAFFSLVGFAAILAARPALAQTEIVLHTFRWSDGSTPYDGLTSDANGNLYGTTLYGGSGNTGVVFELSPNGSGGWTENTLYNFTSEAQGAGPLGPLIFDSAGNLYGTTQNGGAYDKGTVFELSPAGTGWTITTLYSFTGLKDGGYPQTGPIMDRAGNIYLAGSYGVLEVSPSASGWTSKTIYSRPYDDPVAGLVMESAGNIFGVSASQVFELIPNGEGGWSQYVLHIFAGGPNDGAAAQGIPVLHRGNLYGTTSLGGSTNNGTVYEVSPPVKLGGAWREQVLYSFEGGALGTDPHAGIVFDSAGNAYGATISGGDSNDGTVFELVAPVQSGEYNVLWSFAGTDGEFPYGGLILGEGHIYGTTYRGGSTEGECSGYPGCGVVFEIKR